jgi:hypothetical protein
MAKLSDEARSEALQRVQAGERHKDVAADLGVTTGAITQLVSRQRQAKRLAFGDPNAPCEMPEMSVPAPRLDRATPSREPPEKSADAVLLENLPCDGAVSDRAAKAIRLSQTTSHSLT